jgi:uncharacterized protein
VDLNTVAGREQSRASFDEGLRAHMSKVYGLMSVAMLITFLSAWSLAGLAEAPDAASAAGRLENGVPLTDLGVLLYQTPLKWVLMFLPLVMVFIVHGVASSLSAMATQTFFYVFALTMGASLSSIFMVFTGFSIVQVFLVTAIAFAGLSIWGYTTKKDMTGWGSFLLMGVIGLIAASVINIFLQSGAVAFATSVLGVLIFAGLTAYDTQKIKNTYLSHRGDEEWLGKAAVMGALELYLDFINMFIQLLQLLGNRR